jgi:hypothetical protein
MLIRRRERSVERDPLFYALVFNVSFYSKTKRLYIYIKKFIFKEVFDPVIYLQVLDPNILKEMMYNVTYRTIYIG